MVDGRSCFLGFPWLNLTPEGLQKDHLGFAGAIPQKRRPDGRHADLTFVADLLPPFVQGLLDRAGYFRGWVSLPKRELATKTPELRGCFFVLGGVLEVAAKKAPFSLHVFVLRNSFVEVYVCVCGGSCLMFGLPGLELVRCSFEARQWGAKRNATMLGPGPPWHSVDVFELGSS